MLPSFASDIVRYQPAVPRRVVASALFREVLRQRDLQILLALGFALLLAGTSVAIFRFGTTSDADSRLGYFIALFGLFVMSTPVVYWRRLLTSLRFHPLGEAVIQEVTFNAVSKATLQAVENGHAAGRWAVAISDRHFVESFEIDAPWAKLLKPESRVLVLVHPVKSKTIFPVDLIST